LPKERAWIDLGDGIRLFHPNSSSAELEWHVDFEDRQVKIIEAGGWSLQIDNGLPGMLSDDDSIFIPKFTWHRILKGRGNLILKVTKL